MMAAPRVTVVCAFRNEAALIGHTIASLNQQTFTDFDAVFVDDGSDDGSAAIIKRTAAFPHVIITNAMNLGLADSLNLGLRAATAPLVARIDADDLMRPGRLAAQAAAFDSDPSLVLLGSQAGKIDDHGRPLGEIRMPQGDRECRFALNFYSPFVHSATMFRTADALAAGGYRAETFPAEDFDLWIRLSERGSIANLAEILLDYRVRASGSVTSMRRAFQLRQHAKLVAVTKATGGSLQPMAGLHGRKILRLFWLFEWKDRMLLLRKLGRVLVGR